MGVIVSHQLGFAGPEIRFVIFTHDMLEINANLPPLFVSFDYEICKHCRLFAFLRIHRVTEMFRGELERAKDDARAAHEAFR